MTSVFFVSVCFSFSLFQTILPSCLVCLWGSQRDCATGAWIPVCLGVAMHLSSFSESASFPRRERGEELRWRPAIKMLLAALRTKAAFFWCHSALSSPFSRNIGWTDKKVLWIIAHYYSAEVIKIFRPPFFSILYLSRSSFQSWNQSNIRKAVKRSSPSTPSRYIMVVAKSLRDLFQTWSIRTVGVKK